MTKLLLALHLIFAVFAVGPLVHAATTASRGIRRGDAAATASSARLLRIYGIATVLVIAAGFALMYRSPFSFGGGSVSITGFDDHLPAVPRHIGEFSQTWIWLSLVLWVAAIALVFALLVPTLTRATNQITEGDSAKALTARVAATGGIVALAFVVIVVLMVYRPGQ